MDDKDIWYSVDPKDLWVIDKLLLSKRLGYDCGPAGIPPSISKEYVVRPCVNFEMMSKGASFMTLGPDNYKIPVGYFWCEKFQGRHLSFDYNWGKQTLAVEGFREDQKVLDRFCKWIKIEDTYELPDVLKEISERYEWFNVEVIDNKVIEVHYRYNDDFRGHDSNVIYPVWKDKFMFSECGDRLGFVLE